ncbi:MAG: hypothetical protein ACRDVG_05925 [Jatrophihabitantaceae bacterium]
MSTDARTPAPNRPGPPDATGQDAGVEGNARLTASNGLLLIALLAVEGVTILNVRQMITLHMYLGIMLLGPVLLKTASTVYRFVRYYRGAEPYRRKGPPHPVLRLIGPALILTTLAVLGTGIGLIATGPRHREPLLTLHQASFIAWVALIAVHVLGHLRAATLETWHDLRPVPGDAASTRRATRAAAVITALLVGVGAATALMPSATAWTSAHIASDHNH